MLKEIGKDAQLAVDANGPLRPGNRDLLRQMLRDLSAVLGTRRRAIPRFRACGGAAESIRLVATGGNLFSHQEREI